jgi:hypothetical protein
MFDLGPWRLLSFADLSEGVPYFFGLPGRQGIVLGLGREFLGPDGYDATGDPELYLVTRFEAGTAPHLIWHSERRFVLQGNGHN